jgi:hypothetical protein
LKGQRVNRLHYRAIFLILSHRHCIERVSLRIQLFNAYAGLESNVSNCLSRHAKPANDGHLKTGQR